MDAFGYHIPSLIVVGSAFSSVLAAFAKFDAHQSERNREFLRQWLLGLNVDDRQWAQFFKELFAKVFGEQHLSLKCIRRSALLSAAILAVIWTYFFLRYVFFSGNFPKEEYPVGSARQVVLIGILLWIPIAMVIDYFALWKTRVLLTKTELLTNGLSAMAVVVGDVFATIVITLVIFASPALVLMSFQFIVLHIHDFFPGFVERHESVFLDFLEFLDWPLDYIYTWHADPIPIYNFQLLPPSYLGMAMGVSNRRLCDARREPCACIS